MHPDNMDPTEVVSTLEEFCLTHDDEWFASDIHEELGWDNDTSGMEHEESRRFYFPTINAIELIAHSNSKADPFAKDEGLWEL
jgi:hypothetical protein